MFYDLILAFTFNPATVILDSCSLFQMAIIESVAMRQRGGLDFEMHYDNLCALNGLCPLPAVKAHLRQNKLDLNGDRIKLV